MAERGANANTATRVLALGRKIPINSTAQNGNASEHANGFGKRTSCYPIPITMPTRVPQRAVGARIIPTIGANIERKIRGTWRAIANVNGSATVVGVGRISARCQLQRWTRQCLKDPLLQEDIF